MLVAGTAAVYTPALGCDFAGGRWKGGAGSWDWAAIPVYLGHRLLPLEAVETPCPATIVE